MLCSHIQLLTPPASTQHPPAMAHLLRHPTQPVHYHCLKLMQACWPTVLRDQAMERSIKGPSLRPRVLGTQELYSKVRITNLKLCVTMSLKSIHKIALIAHVYVTFHAFLVRSSNNSVRNECTNRFKLTTFRFTVLHCFYRIGQHCFAAVPSSCPFKSVFFPFLQALCSICLCRSISLRRYIYVICRPGGPYWEKLCQRL